MSGHAIQIFLSGPGCTLIWTGSGPNLDQIWNESGIKQKPSGPISATTKKVRIELILLGMAGHAK
jgi:hypothetical protein